MRVVFYKSESGTEPVREWLKELRKEDRKAIGDDIKTAQFGWPIGMPLIEKIEKDIWYVRTNIRDGIARTFFTIDKNTMVLLHGFIKKTESIPLNERQTAKRRLKNLGG
ncbi:MAG: type II toxin-antitoxin system RelE/ParE family toxin [Nitrospirae bacterium]|nr:type II toxin-antitoxin system RelE/ParE family toxin [Nitrospirota bacterium]